MLNRRWVFTMLSGCLVALAGCHHERAHGKHNPTHFETEFVHGSRCAEIEIASEISFSTDRATAFKKIARQELTEHEQLFLIDAVIEAEGFSTDIADILTTLAQNPCITTDARTHLALELDDVDLFASDRAKIVDALVENHTSR